MFWRTIMLAAAPSGTGSRTRGHNAKPEKRQNHKPKCRVVVET